MKKELNIVGNRKIFFSVSIALILIGILCNIFLGVQLDISFKGGTLLKYSYTGDIDEPKLDALITDTLKKDVDTTLSTDGDVNLINVSLVEELSLDETTALTTALTKEYPKSELKLINSNSLDPTMGTMFFVKCLVAIALACVFLLIYVALRFRKNRRPVRRRHGDYRPAQRHSHRLLRLYHLPYPAQRQLRGRGAHHSGLFPQRHHRYL